LVAGAVLFGIFGRTIDDVPLPIAIDVVSEAAAFASHEHDRASMPVDRLQQVVETSCPIESREELAAFMHCQVGDLPCLRTVGYEYVGMRCLNVPDHLPGPAAQLIYRKFTGDGDHGIAPMVTLTLLPDRPECAGGGGVCKDLTAGEWGAAIGDSSCSHKVLRSHDQTFVYLLVCCDEADMQAISATVKRAGGCCGKARGTSR